MSEYRAMHPDDATLATVAWLHDAAPEVFGRIAAEEIRAMLFPDPIPPNHYLYAAEGPIRIGRYSGRHAPDLTAFYTVELDDAAPESVTEVRYVPEQ